MRAETTRRILRELRAARASVRMQRAPFVVPDGELRAAAGAVRRLNRRERARKRRLRWLGRVRG